MRFVSTQLRTAGLEVWVDEQKLTPGVPEWTKTIQNAIEQAACVVVLVSPAVKGSKWVDMELGYAETQGVDTIFPVLVSGDEADIPLRLIAHQRIDMRDTPAKGVQQLISAIKGLPIIPIAKGLPSVPGEILWDRVGSVFWFANDFRGLLNMLNRNEVFTNSEEHQVELVGRLKQCYHHAVRLNIDPTDIRRLEMFLTDWDLKSQDVLYKLRGALHSIFGAIARKAEENDDGFDPGPRWRGESD
jgi:hypothetical protein